MTDKGMGHNAAIYYLPEGYSTRTKRLLGRQSAGSSFLKGLAQFGTHPELCCYAPSRNDFQAFSQQMQAWSDRPLRWIASDRPEHLAEIGTLYKPDPVLTPLAWRRRFGDQRAYSLCGITHTIASQSIMQAIGDLLVAPLQPWDALICTSQAVKTTIDSLLNQWGDYLAHRLGGQPRIDVQLPVIPLGIDCHAFDWGDRTSETRQTWRQQLGIAPDDVVILFVGRLVFYAKAHPAPMYLALERAAQQTDQNVHLIQAGWFESDNEAANFKQAARNFCPSVNAIFLDGRQPEIRQNIWTAADIFTSLSDNIQETFGLTPIEAMAAGLPVIISDWNGYRESVRHDRDGFLIPTIAPPPGAGLDLAASFADESLNYSTYIGHTSIATAVDIEACTRAFVALIGDRQLREHMGQNGRLHARQTYDWQAVIPTYEALWQELAERRTQATESAPRKVSEPPAPLFDDPFARFAHYPTRCLAPNTSLTLGPNGTPAGVKQLRTMRITSFGSTRRASDTTLDSILAEFQLSQTLTITELGDRHPTLTRAELLRSIGYLLKFDCLRWQDKT